MDRATEAKPHTMMSSIRIRRGVPGDAARLAEFAARMFTETFGADNRPSDLAAHLEASYGAHHQTRELLDSDYVTLIGEEDGKLAAYAQVRRGEVPPPVRSDAAVELLRFYVDSRWHGRGVAQLLMQHVREAARDLGARDVWLSVWERNPRAMAFYAKCGFRDFGSKYFFVGSDRQSDRVMVMHLPD